MSESIRGLQEAQQGNLRTIRAVKPTGALGGAVRDATVMIHRFVVAETHVMTGALRASQRMKQMSLSKYMIYIDPDAVNPLGKKPAEYGIYEHARGGTHAFYGNVVGPSGFSALGYGIAKIVGAIRK